MQRPVGRGIAFDFIASNVLHNRTGFFCTKSNRNAKSNTPACEKARSLTGFFCPGIWCHSLRCPGHPEGVSRRDSEDVGRTFCQRTSGKIWYNDVTSATSCCHSTAQSSPGAAGALAETGSHRQSLRFSMATSVSEAKGPLKVTT